MSSAIMKQTSSPTHFSTPEESVPIIAELLKKEDFKTLAGFYDLSNSEVKLVDLESGDFFIRKKRPEVAHPAGFWRYKHPFSPGFKYSRTSPGSRENISIVHVMIEIDQGTDSPSQVGMSSFYMIKSAEGWQILPDRMQEEKAEPEQPEPVSAAPAPRPDPPWMKK